MIFMTIDDNEVHNLRLLLDEIFGPENFVARCIWLKIFSLKNSARQFSDDHAYVLVYARNAAGLEPNPLLRTEEMEARCQNLDDERHGHWTSADISARNPYSKGTYTIDAGRPDFFGALLEEPEGCILLLGEGSTCVEGSECLSDVVA
ncbi:MAG: hypothetical protein F4124_11575 [Acidimicrobiia bacterium]|nr:hypothetical protein [Acidimicrobiia bacterium]MYB72506.1 hypothetical protein [Acidimicrobiia bacterium]MYI00057.1 hypothetical protein [Acidimicrobiia bacterium]